MKNRSLLLILGLLVIAALIIAKAIQSAKESSSDSLSDNSQIDYSLSKKFRGLSVEFKEQVNPKHRDKIDPAFFEIRAAIELLNEVEIASKSRSVRNDILSRLNADPSEGYPKRSDELYSEITEILQSIEKDDPESYPNVLAIALLRASYPADRGVIFGSRTRENVFLKEGIEKAQELTGEDYSSMTREDALVAFGKTLLGIE